MRVSPTWNGRGTGGVLVLVRDREAGGQASRVMAAHGPWGHDLAGPAREHAMTTLESGRPGAQQRRAATPSISISASGCHSAVTPTPVIAG